MAGDQAQLEVLIKLISDLTGGKLADAGGILNG
jgi:hypothetical protein